MADTELRDWALAYARAQWQVFPLRPRGKVPLTKRGFKDATTDLDGIEAWWKRTPAANIGLAVPAGFVVVDIDSREARDELKAAGFVLPQTPWARTKNGWHLWYSTNEAELQNRVGLRHRVDLRAKGGYVVVPPSIHPSGHVYRWGAMFDRKSIVPAPDWVLEGGRVTPRSEASTAPPRFSESPLQINESGWLRRLSQPVHEGRRNQSLAEVAGWFFRRFQANEAEQLTRDWASANLIPPLAPSEVERTIDSIAGLELRRVLAER